jgi:hypothetical protein
MSVWVWIIIRFSFLNPGQHRHKNHWRRGLSPKPLPLANNPSQVLAEPAPFWSNQATAIAKLIQ